jgi:hypothetical protein
MAPRHTAALALLLAAGFARADEGIWLFNAPPREQIRKAHGFDVTDEFLSHLRRSSARFNNGGSASFVSPRGLLFTNHHVGSECIQQLSTPQQDYMTNGFYASAESDEKRCPSLEVNVLLDISDVTGRVTGSAPAGAPVAEANRLRKAAMSQIEKECADRTGNRCDVVTLFSGGQYHLYQYKKYTDIRLVFAPELEIAAFGGDPDNFTYPRYCLDFAFFRAWEDGRPANIEHYLKWSKTGVREGELTFVSGHPGSTGRLATVAELEFSRDIAYPLIHNRLASLIKSLEAYSAANPENRRIARDNLFSQQNSYKAYTGFLAGLRDPSLMDRKHQDETRLRKAVADDPRKQEQFGNIWDEVSRAYAEYAKFYKPFALLERTAARGSELLAISRMVLRYAEEKAKPNEQRLREYAEAGLASLEQSMYSEAPIHLDMEMAVLGDYLKFLRDELGAGDATVKELLAGQSPEKAAEQYVSTSKMKNVVERKRLATDLDAARASNDGMIRMVRIIDGPARALRRRYEDGVEAVLLSSASQIAQARYAVYGAGEYPDATFTLRLSYGSVKGYRNAKGERIPYTTNFAGVYRRATGQDPFRLPPRWIESRRLLRLNTPFNFVTTADTHGGNSGSPTVNTKGEIVGILFDGNIEGLPNRFLYRDERERSVHVASQGIVESLRKVYRTGRVLQELGLTP